jgi:hypothetical protein
LVSNPKSKEEKRKEVRLFDLGLADGAGGNRSLGINPADFSRAILAACRNILRQNYIQPNQLPRLILSAMQQVEASRIRGMLDNFNNNNISIKSIFR